MKYLARMAKQGAYPQSNVIEPGYYNSFLLLDQRDVLTQYTHNAILTFIRRRPNVMEVV